MSHGQKHSFCMFVCECWCLFGECDIYDEGHISRKMFGFLFFYIEFYYWDWSHLPRPGLVVDAIEVQGQVKVVWCGRGNVDVPLPVVEFNERRRVPRASSTSTSVVADTLWGPNQPWTLNQVFFFVVVERMCVTVCVGMIGAQVKLAIRKYCP